MDRYIAFFPSPPEQTKTLSQEQVERFNADGYLRPLPALTTAEVEARRACFDSLLARMQAMRDGRNAYALDGYHNRCRGIWELARTPVLLDYVEDLLGPNFVCWSTHFFCKLGSDAKRVPWHQDATYWPVRPTKTVTAGLAIDDMDADNAPLRFLSGSHRIGAVPWRKAEGDFVLHQEVPDVERFGEPAQNTLQAGQVSIHASTLIHGSAANRSNRRRCGLALRYIPSDCGAIGEHAQAVLDNAVPCRGDTGPWRRTEPPRATT